MRAVARELIAVRQPDRPYRAAQNLVVAVRGRMPLLVREVAGFDGATLSATAVPDDAIEEGLRVVGIVTDHVDADGNPLLYQDAARGELETWASPRSKRSAPRPEPPPGRRADALSARRFLPRFHRPPSTYPRVAARRQRTQRPARAAQALGLLAERALLERQAERMR